MKVPVEYSQYSGKVRDLGVHLRAARPVAAGRRSAVLTAFINLGAARPERRAALKLLCCFTHNGNTPILARLG